MSFADKYSGTSPALRKILKLDKPDFRMRDTELLIRFYAFHSFLPLYAGDLKRFLDQTCETLNNSWATSEVNIKAAAEEFENAYDIAKRIFGAVHVFRKWTGSEYESRFNRAIFDVMMYYFSKPEVARRAVSKRGELEKLFKYLCTNDSQFLSSIERTTKSLEATCARLYIWGTHLKRSLGIHLQVPTLKNKRIVLA